MSTRDPERLLLDILTSIDQIVLFTRDYDLPRYEVDTKTQWAVERALLIIAEVAYRMQDTLEELCPGIPWRSVRALGNLIRHGYEAVLNQRVWLLLQEELPTLRASVSAALQGLGKLP